MVKLFQRSSPEIVTVSIDSQNIIFSWFAAKQKNNLFILNDYENFKTCELFIHDLNIFSPVFFSAYLKTFLKKNNIDNSFIYISLNGNQINDKLIEEESNFEEIPFYASNFYSINHDKKNIFYLANIKHSLLFQYKIFAMNSHINLSKIIPENISKLQLLKFFKPNFLKNIIHINDIETNFNNFIDSYDIQNCIMVSDLKISLEIEKNFLFKNLGIFLLKNFQ